MQKFLSLLFSRRALAVVGVLVLALLVWFVGPLVSFDTLRPLASVGMPGWRKIFEGKRFLYELPWFMVVGSPGDGKTTALLNTGLQFPLAEQMEQTSRILTVPGGGTLHCDWWFTNEAVLIDTAGRYARHDDGGEVSAAQRNAGEWQGFLGLLRKHRPGAPLNGVILTLNVADLTAQSPAERLAACAALRARLADLRETLGIRFPVYLVVTKMDLLPGFSDYFRTLTSHLRAQIWGFSLPYSRRRKAGDPQALHAACAQELARLTLRLDQGLDPGYRKSTTLKAASGCIPSRVSSPPSASRCWRLLNRSSSIQNSMPRN